MSILETILVVVFVLWLLVGMPIRWQRYPKC